MADASAPSLVLGTAGHIDHGKSALVRALTGTDPDRLKEEQERGITIELGFARLELPSGRTMGVVDVPGHERFVRQMVAGATGIDVVLLVVAADDGVMPQTREHLAIIDLLGVTRGVVALTKSDLVDDDWIALVRTDVEGLLAGTSIEGAPIVAVSARTGAGLPELVSAIDAVAAEASARHADLPMRLPVDRVFTISGAGTVVTGTMWSGVARVGDEVEVYPGARRARLRGLQVHGASVDEAHAGQRVAANVAGLDVDEVARGDTLAAAGSLTVTDRFDARVTFLGTPGEDRPLPSGTRMHVHHGTREVLGRVLLMDADELAPGESGFAQVRLEEPLAPRYDDRFILRSYSPVYTVGGGVVLDASPPRRTQLREHEHALLEALASRDVDTAAVALVVARGVPMTAEEAAGALGLPRAEVGAALEAAATRAVLTRVRISEQGPAAYIDSDALDRLVAAIERELLAFHEADPTATGITTAALRDRVDARLSARSFDAVLSEAAGRGVAIAEGGTARHPRAAVSAMAQQDSAAEELLRLLREAGLEPPPLSALASAADVDAGVARKAVAGLVQAGSVVRVNSELHFSAEAISEAQDRLRGALAARPAGATAAELRDALGVSRKFAIPLLEYFDASGFTRRVGDLRWPRG